MKNINKLAKVKQFLDENNIKYKERTKHRYGHSDLYVPDTRVCIKLEGEDDEYFYRRHKKYSHPVFIRKKDAPKFAVDKVANTIRNAMIALQKGLVRKQNKKAGQCDRVKR